MQYSYCPSYSQQSLQSYPADQQESHEQPSILVETPTETLCDLEKRKTNTSWALAAPRYSVLLMNADPLDQQSKIDAGRNVWLYCSVIS